MSITSKGRVHGDGSVQHYYTAHVTRRPVVVSAMKFTAEDQPVIYLAMRKLSVEDAREVHKALGMAIERADELADNTLDTGGNG